MATLSFTPRCNTVWLRTVMPRSKSLSIAAFVISVISRGWLKWVWITTSLCSLRPCSTTPRERVRPGVVGQDLLGHDRRPLVA